MQHPSPNLPDEAPLPAPTSALAVRGALPAPVATAPSASIATRNRLPGTRLAPAPRARAYEVPAGPTDGAKSLVTRRYDIVRNRRLRRVLIVIAVALAIFPPMWAVYLIAWLVWRSRPHQRSMRGVMRAVRALERNQSGIARKELQEAHLLDPGNMDALYWLGLLMSQQNRHEEAADALSVVAERAARLPEVEAALIDAYIATDEADAAIYHAQRLYEIAPHDPDSVLRLADAFEAAGRLELAVQALEQAPMHRRVIPAALLPVHYRLGLLYEKMGDTAQAIHHFTRVFAKDVTYEDVQTRLKALEGSLGS